MVSIYWVVYFLYLDNTPTIPYYVYNRKYYHYYSVVYTGDNVNIHALYCVAHIDGTNLQQFLVWNGLVTNVVQCKFYKLKIKPFEGTVYICNGLKLKYFLLFMVQLYFSLLFFIHLSYFCVSVINEPDSSLEKENNRIWYPTSKKTVSDHRIKKI